MSHIFGQFEPKRGVFLSYFSALQGSAFGAFLIVVGE
jgi:hypothetical protein